MNTRYYVMIVLIAAIILVAQAFVFGLVWSAAVSHAVEHGRTQRGGVGIGLSMYFGFRFLMIASFVASVLSGSVRHPTVRWIAVLFCLSA